MRTEMQNINTFHQDFTASLTCTQFLLYARNGK